MDTSRLLSRRNVLVLGTGAAALAAGALPSAGPLQTALAQDGAVRYCNTNGVRLRSGPGLSYRIVSTLSSGTRVTVIGQANPADGYQWTRVTVSVQSDILQGYVASQFLSQSSGGNSRFPVGSTFSINTPNGQAANLRSAPGTGSQIVRVVANRTQGTILGGPTSASGYRWYKVAIAGATGYLADFLMVPGSGSTRPPGQATWPVGSRVVVSDGPLNLRDTPYGTILATYATGSLATTIERAARVGSGNVVWYRVRTDQGQQGWFAADYLRLA